MPRAILTLSLWLMMTAYVVAHPHILVNVRTRVMFAADGKLTALIHDWVFDDMYSAFLKQGLTTKGQHATQADFVPLVKDIIKNLEKTNYYTELKINGQALRLSPAPGSWMEERVDHRVAFHMRLDVETPAAIHTFASLSVADPEYYVKFDFDAPPLGVTLDHAPAGCSNSLAKPPPLTDNEKANLTESMFTNLSPGSNFGLKMATQAILACP